MTPVRRFGVAAALGLALVTTACGTSTGSGAGNGRPAGRSGPSAAAVGTLVVVAGENFWGNIAAQIGGNQVAVTSIISDPNADPHEYETDVKDAAAIAHAGVVIVNGGGYDDFMGKLLAASPNRARELLTVSKIVGVTGNHPNPHFWYAPAYVMTAARAMEAQFAVKQPAGAARFAANLSTFLAGEQHVDDVIDTIKARYQGTSIAYTERVPGYLIEAAGLHLGTPAAFSQAIEDGNDPSPIDNATFEKDLVERKVRALLVNAQVTDSQTSHLTSVARSSHVPIVGVTETLPPKYKTFQTWQAAQAEALLAALGG